ncbi:MAG: cross-pathway control WD-repeat protein cpc2 [Paramarteilia canceri]
MKKHSNVVSSIVLIGQPEHLLSSSYDKKVLLWDLNKPETPVVFKAHSKAVLTADISQDGRHVITGGADNKILLWNILGNPRSESQEHQGFVNHVQFNLGFSSIFLSCSQNDEMLAFEVSKPLLTPFARMTGHNSPVVHFDQSPDGTLAVSIGANSILFYDICISRCCQINEIASMQRRRLPKYKKDKNKGPVYGTAKGSCIKFSPADVCTAFTYGNCLQVMYLNQKVPQVTASLVDEEYETTSNSDFTKLNWSNDGKYIFTGATDGCVRIYEHNIQYSHDDLND